ncbi:precorrin-6x reductase [Desulfuribacillus stibiiarsenatis]|uniref:Precorrin-6x reductase n=1 Tax=Desulfuribacillus stibiiarsenatis TaxID=1390249 RepID=A0A1E5L490_9FIRM|nr:precorrin-6A reductase [Desulfuribacillus stibiiarsenatis]OEH84759.1 precorrin-6x reductase [Desulfuribacillus stibiiarsenatis]
MSNPLGYRILLFGGTQESREFVMDLKNNHPDLFDSTIVSVTSSYGASLLPCGTQVYIQRLNVEDMLQFCLVQKVRCIVDLSHPFAAQVSINAIDASEKLKIQYIRFEREPIHISNLSHHANDNLHIVYSYEEAAKVAFSLGERILLTTGSKTLKVFVDYRTPNKHLMVRVLPTSEVITICESLGFTPDHIIAMKGPFSKKMNQMILEDYKIDVMVTKESGATGGFAEKVEAALEMNIKAIVIARPNIQYPFYTNAFEDIYKKIYEVA